MEKINTQEIISNAMKASQEMANRMAENSPMRVDLAPPGDKAWLLGKNFAINLHHIVSLARGDTAIYLTLTDGNTTTLRSGDVAKLWKQIQDYIEPKSITIDPQMEIR